ncbi:menaquinone biosynthetic enzyme MqnA/MqnD family protein [Desulfotomaculum sp. 1211_IL3151]|uniref:menaquinone biosynthetic enzyme MqnA/MqnD family protein n=1 Tax=Desulfotomaculum sp. 1211_IL3151 TaxID=3084055 RepID=UPI002FD9B9B6
MAKIRFGQVEYLNALPVFHALEEGLLAFDGKLIKGSPAVLNKMFLAGQLDIASISSIEYARNMDQCMILPDLSVSGDGPVKNALLFSKIPVMELEGKKVCLTDSSATSTALLKVLFDHYYHLEANFITMQPDLDRMMTNGDGVLLIGDDALRAYLRVRQENLPYHVTDLGEIWKQFTGEPMVYTLWVIRRDFARENQEVVGILHNQLVESKQYVNASLISVLEKSRRRSGLPTDILEEYYQVIENGFTENHKKALLTFYDYCYKSGLIEERVRLAIWGE